MKTALSESEKRFKEVLVRAGFSDAEIKIPDADDTIVGTADFLVRDVAFEVKEIAPDKEALEEVERLTAKLKEDRFVAHWRPPVLKQFKKDLKLARRQLGEYENCATVLVEDMTDWGLFPPYTTELLFGVPAVQIDTSSNRVLADLYTDRVLRTDLNRTIGSYIFLRMGEIEIYHNLMAYEFRMMPVEFIRMFQQVASNQFIFVNLPNGGNPLIRELK